jgi:hypothetical protein
VRTSVLNDVASLFEEGAAVVAAIPDEDLRPHITRCWGPELLAADGSVRLCVDAPVSSEARADLAPGAEIAVTFARPTTYRSVQLKGLVTGLDEEISAGQERLVGAHLERFEAEAGSVGVSPRQVGRIFDRAALLSVTFSVLDAFGQTPGPGAGARL